MRCDLHVHSKYSYDSIMEPRKILKIYQKKGYDMIAITDHNTIRGALVAKKYEKDFGVHVLIGEEILTDAGDIIAIDLSEEIRSRSWVEVIDEIRDQGALSIFPHPFRGHKEINLIAEKVDLIEAWNSRSSPHYNELALKLAEKFKKPPLAGSDAHIYSEIGNAYIEFEDIFDFSKKFMIKYCKRYEKVLSYLIKDIKVRDFYKIPFHLLRLFI